LRNASKFDRISLRHRNFAIFANPFIRLANTISTIRAIFIAARQRS
jgi:hypothetical protein